MPHLTDDRHRWNGPRVVTPGIPFLALYSCSYRGIRHKVYWNVTKMSGQDSSRRRARNVKRTVVLLRNDDDLRVPEKQKLKTLQDSGRIKEIEFSNNATSESIGEILMNSFSNFLTPAELPRWDYKIHKYNCVFYQNFSKEIVFNSCLKYGLFIICSLCKRIHIPMNKIRDENIYLNSC